MQGMAGAECKFTILCHKTIISDVFAVQLRVLLPVSRGLSVGLQMHHTEQWSEILSPSLSVNAIS